MSSQENLPIANQLLLIQKGEDPTEGIEPLPIGPVSESDRPMHQQLSLNVFKTQGLSDGWAVVKKMDHIALYFKRNKALMDEHEHQILNNLRDMPASLQLMLIQHAVEVASKKN